MLQASRICPLLEVFALGKFLSELEECKYICSSKQLLRNNELINNKKKFKASGAPRTSGARGLCPRWLHGRNAPE